ncbi:iron-sulfur cluster co-chaperone HscB C-terminal domain-containing protein [Chitinophaga lutea]
MHFRKIMNYFELFGLPVSLMVNEALLQHRYLGLPGSDEAREAFVTLTDRVRLVEYVLVLKGAMRPGEKLPLPHMFQMEMMALNERLFALEAAPLAEVQQFRTQLAKLEERLWAELPPEAELTEGFLAELKEYHAKQKYLLRIQERLSTFASRDQPV